MNLDGFFGRAYHPRAYNCAHLAVEVWEHITKRKVPASIAAYLVPGGDAGKLGHMPGVQFVPTPVDPCFVLMRSKVREPHAGIYHGGRVIHLAGNHKVHYQPLEIVTAGYTRVRFFTC